MESMHSLNEAHSCRRARDMGYAAKEGAQPENYFRAVIIIAVIRWALILYLRVLAKEPDKKEVMEYMATRYPECRFKIYQQMQQQLLQDHNYVMRYLQDEKRKPWFPKSMPVQIGSRVYDVHCHVAFPCDDQIELVYFKIGKPNMTQTGRGNAFQRDMFLYALQLYGRALGFKYITSSIYFLKKSSDRQYWNQNDQNFFGSGDNIIQITDIYDGKPTPLDEKMAPLIAKLDAGIDPEEQDEETCAYCENFDLCKYKKAPLRIEIAKPVAGPAVTKFTYSEQQQKVLDFRSGIARVIAGAGSGKTEVITERVARMILSGVRPETILMVTFSRSAAKEMKRRVEKKVG
ncbi:MAG: UvrD-helicase domain-containing protein [Oscillospiraceae bacterium]|nr:UvrD-helicase domain-containing protein [Oscillospiraceae bacterium]